MRKIFATSNAPVGVRLEPGESLDEIAQDIPRLALIALSFPAYTDGRSFSKAQLLRERFGFSGELRAIGDILTDQLQMLRRCGFDALEIADARTRQALEAGHVWNQTRYYQPSAIAESRAGARPWLRRPGV